MVEKGTFFIVTLGCAKNEFDSFLAKRRLERAGFRESASPDAAEFVVLNTCSFIEDAVKETFEVASGMINSLKQGQRFVFAGCAVNYFGNRVKEAVDADLYLSTGAFQMIDSYILKRGLFLERDFRIPETCSDFETAQEGRVYAYLKIAEGCSNRCSYCLIPLIRGKTRSIPEELLLKEAERLVSSGVKEINLIAQDLASYGKDLGRQKALYGLVKRISEAFKGKEVWIRLLYLNPDTVDFEMLQETYLLPNVVPYLEMPVQSGSPSVLARMGRRRSPEEILEGIEELKKKIKGLSVRTAFLVGFPGETEKEFEETVDFLNRLRPDFCHVFAYSDMEGTRSFCMGGKVEPARVYERSNHLSEICYRIMEEKASEREGTTVRVLVEESSSSGSVGRAFFQAPEIDGKIRLNSKLSKGQFADVLLEFSEGIDFRGKVVRT